MGIIVNVFEKDQLYLQINSLQQIAKLLTFLPSANVQPALIAHCSDCIGSRWNILLTQMQLFFDGKKMIFSRLASGTLYLRNKSFANFN